MLKYARDLFLVVVLLVGAFTVWATLRPTITAFQCVVARGFSTPAPELGGAVGCSK